MNNILLIGTFEAFFLILLLMGKNNKSRSDFFLGIVFLLYAVNIGAAYLEMYSIKNNFQYPNVLSISWLILFLHGPALLLYIKSLSDSEFRFKPFCLLHLIPFLLFSVYHYSNFIHLPANEKIHAIINDLYKEDVFYKISVLSVAVSTIAYNVWALKIIWLRRNNRAQKFSKTEELNWLKVLIAASLICFLINETLFILDLIFGFASKQFLMILSYSFSSVYVLTLGYFGLKQGNIFTTELKEEIIQPEKDTAEPNIQTGSKKDIHFINYLIEYMENRKPYLDPEISISKLSDQLDVNTYYLSEILNSHLKENFFDFINKYRIREFKNQSSSATNNHLSILGIAFNCGFNSKASFYRAFKKFEGVSPGAYIEAVSQHNETTFPKNGTYRSLVRL